MPGKKVHSAYALCTLRHIATVHLCDLTPSSFHLKLPNHHAIYHHSSQLPRSQANFNSAEEYTISSFGSEGDDGELSNGADDYLNAREAGFDDADYGANKSLAREKRAWVNSWYRSFSVECNDGYGWTRQKSYHSNRKEDRRFDFTCTTVRYLVPSYAYVGGGKQRVHFFLMEEGMRKKDARTIESCEEQSIADCECRFAIQVSHFCHMQTAILIFLKFSFASHTPPHTHTNTRARTHTFTLSFILPGWCCWWAHETTVKDCFGWQVGTRLQRWEREEQLLPVRRCFGLLSHAQGSFL